MTERPRDLAALQKLFTWLSPGFPVGSFAYSHGLEQAIAEGYLCDEATVEAWLSDCLTKGSGRNDAILMAHAWRGEDMADLALALAGPAERRRESSEQGAALARILRAVEGPADPGPYVVVLAVAAARAGIALPDLLALYLQAFLANLVAACVKSVPLGQTAGQGILSRLQPEVRAVTAEALLARLEDLGGCAFRADLMAMRHETLEPRIYRT